MPYYMYSTMEIEMTTKQELKIRIRKLRKKRENLLLRSGVCIIYRKMDYRWVYSRPYLRGELQIKRDWVYRSDV